MSKNLFTVTVEMDRAKQARAESRARFGQVGRGRKTSFKDKRKDENRRACRGNKDHE